MRRGERGISLIEATIILMVLATLSAAIAPAIGTYTNDARGVAAKSEVETIGAAVNQLLRDTGSRCLRLSGADDCTVTNRVDLLVTSGRSPSSVDTALAPNVVLPDSEAATNGTVNWLPSGNAPTQQDLLEDQLIENDNPVPYAVASFTGGGGPRMKGGWRGAYLNGPITADPWSIRYQVNTMFLAVATNATDSLPGPTFSQTQEGLREAGWHRDVLVLSAGANRVVETSFGGTATGGVMAGGDDVVYVLRGSSR
jgi:type II secretory pathway pseudopilin PulG